MLLDRTAETGFTQYSFKSIVWQLFPKTSSWSAQSLCCQNAKPDKLLGLPARDRRQQTAGEEQALLPCRQGSNHRDGLMLRFVF